MNRLFLSVSVALSATTCSFAQQITQPNLVLFIQVYGLWVAELIQTILVLIRVL